MFHHLNFLLNLSYLQFLNNTELINFHVDFKLQYIIINKYKLYKFYFDFIYIGEFSFNKNEKFNHINNYINESNICS